MSGFAGDERVARIEKVLDSGWSLNMTLVRLDDGSVLVHSPTWIDDDTFARVEAFGEPRVLFAPNHFHHLSLKKFAGKYPRAKVVAGSAAIARIVKKSGLVPRPVHEIEDMMPKGARWLECEGTAAGETWLSLREERELLVSDAFFNVNREVTGAVGFILGALKTFPGLSLGQTFRWFALRSDGEFGQWAKREIARDAPKRLWTSHGDEAEGDDLVERLTTLIERRLK
jgi:hypothetical protein